MRKVKFSDCVEYMIKGPFGSDMKKSLYVPKGDDTYKVYIQVNAIQRNQSVGEYYVSEEYFHKKLERFEVHPGDYLITCDGTLGKFIKLDENSEKGVISSSLLLLKLKEDVIYDKYFELIWEYSMLGYLAAQARNACLVHLPSAKAIGDVEIILPDLTEQIELADRAFSVSDIVEKRKTELALFDNLIKARFVEMFGDYHTNSKGFECHTGSELFKFSSGKFLPEERRLDAGVPVYGGNGIAWYTDEALIDYPTVIIGRVGAWCGNVHTVLEPVWITDNAIFIKEQKTDKFTLEFLTEMMKVMDFHQYADFSGQPKITQKPLESLNYLTPPVEMQNKFTDFVKQVDKSKVVVQKALDEAQLLFDSLMQEYFG